MRKPREKKAKGEDDDKLDVAVVADDVDDSGGEWKTVQRRSHDQLSQQVSCGCKVAIRE